MVMEQTAIDVLLYSLAGVALFMGSVSDLKTREVPDWLSYGLMFGALGLRLLYSLSFFEWGYFFAGVAGFVVFVAVGYLMYYTGQWGGGDAKLLMGMGAVLGIRLSWFSSLPIFFLSVLLVGAVYGLLWILFLGFVHRKRIGSTVQKLRTGTTKVQLAVIISSVSLLVIVGLLWYQGLVHSSSLLFASLPLLGYYGWLVVKSVEEVAFVKQVLPEHLTEGDWIVDDIIVDGQKVCGPSDLGIEKEQIAKLIHLRDKGKITTVRVKDGIPFVPSFFIAFMILLWLRQVMPLA